MTTTNKDFRVKNGLVVEGTAATVNGNTVLTSASSIDNLSDVVITTPTTNEVLLYNGTNWINSSSGGGGTTTNALTIGTGLSGTSFNGSTAVTIAIDSTVATTSGTQTLTNKTIDLSSNTLTATSAQIASAVTDETGTGALVFGTAPTLTAGVTIKHTAGNTLFTFNNDQNGNMEIGRTDGVASTPYLDFHSGATAVDHDVRLIFSGGNGVSGNGTMNIVAGALTRNSVAIPTISSTDTLTNKTLTTPTINTPLLTLSTTSSTTEGRIAWDSTNDKILVGGTLNGTAQAIEFASSTLNISTPTFTTNAYTVVLTDKDKWLELTNGATAGTLNIPTDATTNFPIGTQLNIIQTNTGQITIAASTPATTTINGTPGLKLRGQWSSATIIKRAANLWVAVGDLSE